MKKNFLPQWEFPTLIQGQRWYINLRYIDPITGSRERFRCTFNLNRIKDFEKRKRRGEELVEKITWWLEQGRHVNLFDEKKVPDSVMLGSDVLELGKTNVIEAIDYILKLKGKTASKDTLRSYRSTAKYFLLYLKKYRWDRLAINEITRRHASGYMDSCLVDRDLGAYAYNNNLRYMRAIFNELVRKEYLNVSPWGEIPYMEKTEKKRRNFTLHEAQIVIHRIRRDNTLLFYALLFEYCCFMRPTEITKLQGEDVDINQGMIRLPSSKAKNNKTKYKTIPDDFLPYFDLDFFNSIPARYYIFGKGFKPSPYPYNRDPMSKRHKRILEQLQAEGALKSIDGLQWYSWKDTGITDALEMDNMSILAVQDQAGHHSPDMTLTYRHQKRVNNKIKTRFKNNLL